MNPIEYLWQISQGLFKVAEVLFQELQSTNPFILLFGPGVGFLLAKIILAFRSV